MIISMYADALKVTGCYIMFTELAHPQFYYLFIS